MRRFESHSAAPTRSRLYRQGGREGKEKYIYIYIRERWNHEGQQLIGDVSLLSRFSFLFFLPLRVVRGEKMRCGGSFLYACAHIYNARDDGPRGENNRFTAHIRALFSLAFFVY